MSAALELGLRPLRLFAVMMAIGCLAAAAATVVTATLAARAQVVVVGLAPAGQAITLSTTRATGALVVLASRPGDVSADTTDTCSLSGARHAAKISYSGVGGPTLQRDGAVLRRLAAVSSGWRDGERLTCSGPHLSQVAVVKDARRGLLLRAGLFAFVTLGAGLLAVLGFMARRRAGATR